MSEGKSFVETAVAMGVESFEQTTGKVPDSYKVLIEHAPQAFAGYGLIRSSVMKDGALDLKTKELIFTFIDVVLGVTEGAKVHAANAVRMGASIEALSEGMVQCIMAAGITTWNTSGRVALEHAIQTKAELEQGKAAP